MLIDTGINIDSTPIINNPFYIWLNTAEVDPIAYKSITKWLIETFSFRVGIDSVPEDQLKALGWTHDHWFFKNRRRD